MDDFARAAFREREARRILRRRAFWVHASIYLATNIALVAVWVIVGGGYPWFLFPILGWGIGLAAHGVTVYMDGEGLRDRMIQEELEKLRKSRLS